MESGLLDTAAAASLCPAVGGPRRAGSTASFLNCACSSRDCRVSASYSIGRMLSGVRSAARKKLFRNDPADLLGISNWLDSSGTGGHHHWWTALENNFVLEASEDEYGGVIVDADRLPADTAAFARSLTASLSYWKSVGKKGVWLKLPADRAEFVPFAVKEGFKYHHAEEAYVMLTYWIPDEPCMLPANASHQVGVGGFVINDQMEVLVVQEKYCGSLLDGAWKLPTGFILASEEIYTGASREVKEETGVDTEFVDVVAFRHAHNVAFQKSDLFFICMLRPVSSEIKIDETEIQAAKWMPLEEFVKQPFIQEDHMFQKIMDICLQRLRKCYCGLTAHHVVSRFDGRASTLYYNVEEPEDVNCSAA
ncbi:nudix hydrolase 8-like isoform X1 [Phragmites australis]|uniref:nudix hydrolase 8-like isoform X1 n=2 Tax=Phragmites australis TaxID=29695 RepID=UPI002D764EEA|nr:nudix hydrolase 8-like isoform X1 [Phragmites australis]